MTTSHTHSDPVSVALLIAEVQQLRHDVRQLLDRMPNPSKTWLTPKEFAAYADVSTRTLRAWRAEGRFRADSIRPTSGGWQFHAERAASDLRELCVNAGAKTDCRRQLKLRTDANQLISAQEK